MNFFGSQGYGVRSNSTAVKQPEDESEESNPLSQGTPPLIRIKDIATLCTPPSGHTSSVASIFQSTQKRKAQRQDSPNSQVKPSKPSTVAGSANKKEKPTNTTPQRSTSQRKSTQSGSRKPNAKNSGMKFGALEKYFPSSTASPCSVQENVAVVAQNSSSLQQLALTAFVAGRTVPNGNELLGPPERQAETNENNAHAAGTPRRAFNPGFTTPPKPDTPQTLEGVSSITIIPRPRAPPKSVTSTRIQQETTPPPEEPVPNLEPVRRQLDFGENDIKVDPKIVSVSFPSQQPAQAQKNPKRGRIPPQQKNPVETMARIAAFRKRQMESESSADEDGEDAEDSSKENNGTTTTTSMAEDENFKKSDGKKVVSLTLKGAPEIEKVVTRRVGPLKPPLLSVIPARTSKPKKPPTVRRRLSNTGISSNNEEGGSGPFKRKSADLFIPPSLFKVLKARFGDDVKSSYGSNPLIMEMDSKHLAFLLQRCTKFRQNEACVVQPLTPSCAPKLEQSKTLDFFTKGLERVVQEEGSGSNLRRKTMLHLLEVFQLVYENLGRPTPNNCYFLIFVDLFRSSAEEYTRRVKEDEALKFVDTVVKLMKVTYDEYMDATVKISFPFIASLLQGTDTTLEVARKNVRDNFLTLVNRIFSCEETSNEFALLIAVLNMAVAYFVRFQNSERYFCRERELLDTLWNGIQGRQRYSNTTTDWGLALIKNIKHASFGKKICSRVIVENLDELRITSFSDVQLDHLFGIIAQCPVVCERVKLDYDHGRAEQDKNLRGETNFHRACALRPVSAHPNRRVAVETNLEYLDHLLMVLLNPDSNDGDINAVDYNGNTCLHDAAQNGRLDAIKLLALKCWNPNLEPSRTNLDLLAQDSDGNTPLHIALSSLMTKIGKADLEMLQMKVDVVKFLVQMSAQAPKKNHILFATMNNKKETVFAFGVPGNAISEDCSKFLESQKPSFDFRSFSASTTIDLQEESLLKIRDSSELQRIVAYWEFFYKKTL